MNSSMATIVIFMMATGIESRSLKNTQELTWVSGMGKDCLAACTTPLVFASPFKKQSPSYSCRIKMDNGDLAPGFQTLPSQCTASYNGKAVTSAAYECGCLDGTTTPGLDTQVGGSCGNACTSLYNTPGAALSDGVGSICMATDEQGTTNHFGTTKDGSCNYVSGLSSTSVTSNAFSCVCSFAQALKTAG